MKPWHWLFLIAFTAAALADAMIDMTTMFGSWLPWGGE